MKENADDTRILVRREYMNVQARLRRIFKIPKEEMIIDFIWNKNENSLILTTIKD